MSFKLRTAANDSCRQRRSGGRPLLSAQKIGKQATRRRRQAARLGELGGQHGVRREGDTSVAAGDLT